MSHHQHVLKSDAPLSSASSSHHLPQTHDDDDDDVDALRQHLREAANNQQRNHHNPLAAEDDEDLGGGVGIEPGEITGPLTSTTTASRGSSGGGGLLLGVDDGGGCGGGGGSDVESERSAVTGASSGERQSRVHFCGECKKTFYNSYNLKRHVKAVHEGIAQGATKPAIRFKRKKEEDTSSNDDTQSQVSGLVDALLALSCVLDVVLAYSILGFDLSLLCQSLSLPCLLLHHDLILVITPFSIFFFLFPQTILCATLQSRIRGANSLVSPCYRRRRNSTLPIGRTHLPPLKVNSACP